MHEFLEGANALNEQLLADRRYIHQHAEVGCALPVTTAYIIERLTELGYEPKEVCPGCVVASAGKPGGKTILLRADIDALPMAEASGLPFASQSPNAAHTCGHDLHGAMLLGAAALLKQHESELKGEVRLLFQPDEEGLTGARAAIEAGVLEGVDVAVAQHVFPGKIPVGVLLTNDGATMASQDRFTITIEGHGGHGAMPHNTVDPINVGAHIHLALQAIIAREIDTTQPAVITVGRFVAGDAANIIPQTAVLEGTIRCFSPEVREQAKQRLVAVCQSTAEAFRAKCGVEFPVETPPNMNDKALAGEMSGYVRELGCPVEYFPPATGSEDFAYIAEKVPSVYFALGAGGEEPEYNFASNHHPKVIFNEGCLPYGAAAMAWCAKRWLEGAE